MAINTLTLRVRKNAGVANGNITYQTGDTGQKEDTSNTNTFAAGDEINYEVETGGTTGTQSVNHIGALITNTIGSSLIKTFNGLARASVKTVNGLALASVKTWNGLA